MARESSRVGARDERFAADAARVDRIRGDRFGDGASRSRASQLTRATPRNPRDPITPTAEPRRTLRAQQSADAHRSNSAGSDVDLARPEMRIIRTMQSSGRPRHDG